MFGILVSIILVTKKYKQLLELNIDKLEYVFVL